MNIPNLVVQNNCKVSVLSRGCWQLASDHSFRGINDPDIFQGLEDFIDAGITTLVCSDLYQGVESLIGRFIGHLIKERGHGVRDKVQIHTTYAPAFMDDSILRNWTPNECISSIDNALKRLKVDSIDAVHLHWDNYSVPGYIEAAATLQELHKSGKIGALGVTNFNVSRLAEIISSGVNISYNTVQYSVLDRRPECGMSDYCLENNIYLCCYGALAGGFLSDNWVGKPDPGNINFHHASKQKYYQIINDFGGWGLYQEILETLRVIADKHHTSIANVALCYILDKPSVGSIIVGAFDSNKLKETVACLDVELDSSDLGVIRRVLDKSIGPNGDCYELERAEGRLAKAPQEYP